GFQISRDGERIEQLEMSSRIEQGLLITLPVNVGEIWLQLAKQRLSSELVIDKYLVAAARRKLSSNNDLVGVNLNARISEKPGEGQIAFHRKRSFDGAAFAARSQKIRCESPAD